jgi:hypothetical protein
MGWVLSSDEIKVEKEQNRFSSDSARLFPQRDGITTHRNVELNASNMHGNII